MHIQAYMPVITLGAVAPAPPASSADLARRALDGEELSCDSRTAKDLRRCVERFQDVTGDRADAIDDAAFVLSSVKPGERLKDAARPFERLLLAADGIRSDAVRDAYALVRGGSDARARESAVTTLTQACGGDMREGVSQAKVLMSLAKDDEVEDLARTWADILVDVSPAQRSSLPAAIQQVLTSADKAGDLRRFRRLVEAGAAPAAALVDLQRVRDLSKTGVDADEAQQLLERLRSAGIGDDASLQAAIGVLAPADADSRKARKDSFERLLSVEGDPTSAREDLEWILATGVRTDDVDDATDRFLRLRDTATKAERPSVHATFDVLEKAVLEEPQGWLSRVFGRTHPAERAIRELQKIEHDPDAAAKHLAVIQQHRGQGETLRDGVHRYRELMLLDELDDAATAVTAFDTLAKAPTAGDAGPQPRWERFKSITKAAGSVKAALSAWDVMAAATTTKELDAREAAFRELLAREEGRGHDALTLLDAMKAGLGPSDSINDAMTIMKSLRASNKVGQAAVIYRTSVGWRNLPGNPFPTLEKQTAFFDAIFSKAGSEGSIRSLVERMEKPVGSETLFQRAEVLRDLQIALRGTSAAINEYDWMAGELPRLGPFPELAGAYALLLGTVRGRGVDARSLFTWLVDLKAKDDRFKDIAIPDMIQRLAQVLLLENDLEKAKTAFLKREVEPGTVDVGETEVVIGGIRVPKKSGGTSE